MVRFDDRLRDKRGMVTTLSMEESRLRQSLARLDREYLQIGGGGAAPVGSGDDFSNLSDPSEPVTEEMLLASLQRLDLHLKGFPGRQEDGAAAPQPPLPSSFSTSAHAPVHSAAELEAEARELAAGAGKVHGITSTTPRGFKRREVSLAPSHPSRPTAQPKAQVQRNLPPAAAHQQSASAVGFAERRSNVGFTNGKASQQQPAPTKPDAGQVPAQQEGAGLLSARGSGAAGKTNNLPCSPKRKAPAAAKKPARGLAKACGKNEPVRRHLGESGGKIVLSEAARALLL